MFELATRLGCTLSELGDKLTLQELGFWRYYYREPRGETRQDYHAAQIAHALYDVIRAMPFRKRMREYSLEKFLLKFQDRTKQSAITGILGVFGKFIPEDAKKKLRSAEKDKNDT